MAIDLVTVVNVGTQLTVQLVQAYDLYSRGKLSEGELQQLIDEMQTRGEAATKAWNDAGTPESS